MARRAKRSAAILAFFVVLSAGKALATTTSYYGCLYCEPVAPTGLGANCANAPAGTEVGFVKCTEISLGSGLFTSDPSCTTEGNACMVINVGGGGGGGTTGGGGGGGNCARGAGGVCEAECFSCGGGQQQ
jgi:hypothetical protein